MSAHAEVAEVERARLLRLICLAAAMHSEKDTHEQDTQEHEENHTTQNNFHKQIAVIDGPPKLGRDARAFCCSGPDGGIADPESSDAPADFPCGSMPCGVLF